LTTDGLIGTPPTEPEIPNGNLNQLFWKLLQNDCAIANFIQNSLTRTYGVGEGNAPAVDTIPDPLPGAPAEPTSGAVHSVIFSNFEVTYRYNSETPAWEELARIARTEQLVQVYEATVTVDLEEGDTESVFSIPTETDSEVAFAFAMKDLSLIYVNNADVESPIVGVVPGLNIDGPLVRLALSAAIPAESEYQLVAIFRRTVVS
jgi:hypothetical protein